MSDEAKLFKLESNPYLPSKASPVTETQSGQPRPSPVLTRVSRVPLCRLLRCQPAKHPRWKELAETQSGLSGTCVRRVYFSTTPEDTDRFCKLLSQHVTDTIETTTYTRKNRKIAFDPSIHSVPQQPVSFLRKKDPIPAVTTRREFVQSIIRSSSNTRKLILYGKEKFLSVSERGR